MLWEGITKLTSERSQRGKTLNETIMKGWPKVRHSRQQETMEVTDINVQQRMAWLFIDIKLLYSSDFTRDCYPWGYLGIVCKRNKPRGFSNVNRLFVLLEIQSTAPWFPVWYYRDYQMVRDGPNPRVFQCRVLKFCRDPNLDLNCLTQAGYTSGRHRLSCGKEQVKFVPDPCSLHPEMWTSESIFVRHGIPDKDPDF